jgi:GxxExxY protein
MNGLRVPSSLPPELEKLMRDTIGSCLAVHREFGPGMSEVVYSRATCMELDARCIPFEAEKPIAIRYRGKLVCQQRIDLFVDDRLVVEIKSVERIHPVHVAQVVSYLRLTGARAGLVVNFNVPILKQGLRRVVL